MVVAATGTNSAAAAACSVPYGAAESWREVPVTDWVRNVYASATSPAPRPPGSAAITGTSCWRIVWSAAAVASGVPRAANAE